MSGGVVDYANAGFVEHWEGETMNDKCFSSLVERLRYLAQVAKTVVMQNSLAAAADRIEALETSNKELLKWHQATANLSAGWDEHGSLGPKEPYSWESIARMAMDYARAAIFKAKA